MSLWHFITWWIIQVKLPPQTPEWFIAWAGIIQRFDFMLSTNWQKTNCLRDRGRRIRSASVPCSGAPSRYAFMCVSHTFIYLWRSATISALATYWFSIFGAAHPILTHVGQGTRERIAWCYILDTVNGGVVFHPPVKPMKKRRDYLTQLALPLQRRQLASSSRSSPHKEHQTLKPVFVMAEQCNIMWHTGDFFLKAYTERTWKTRLLNSSKSLKTPQNDLFNCQNLGNSVW